MNLAIDEDRLLSQIEALAGQTFGHQAISLMMVYVDPDGQAAEAAALMALY